MEQSRAFAGSLRRNPDRPCRCPEAVIGASLSVIARRPRSLSSTKEAALGCGEREIAAGRPRERGCRFCCVVHEGDRKRSPGPPPGLLQFCDGCGQTGCLAMTAATTSARPNSIHSCRHLLLRQSDTLGWPCPWARAAALRA
ncbi:hypothetical protein MTO96_016826 [Rhipicephalus appendiculatus]